MRSSSSDSQLPRWNELFPHWGHPVAPLGGRVHDAVGSCPINEAELGFALRIERMPKRERHVHLEAAVPRAFYAELAQTPGAAERIAKAGPPYANFMDFIRSWVAFTTQLQQLDDVVKLVKAATASHVAQNILDADFHVSVLDHSCFRARFGLPAKPLPIPGLLEAVHMGAEAAEKEHPAARFGFIIDAVYPSLPEERAELLSALRTHLVRTGNMTTGGRKVFVGIGLGGPEQLLGLDALAPFLDECRELGLYVDIHSGETSTAADHLRAVNALRPNRIGHGISGAQDGWFFKDGHISACPLSNLVTNVWPHPLEQHPLRAMLAAQCDVSLNSDDPILFGNSLTLECVAARRALLASEQEIIEMVRSDKQDRGMPRTGSDNRVL